MAQNYFNNDHFKLLNKWKGTVYDKDQARSSSASTRSWGRPRRHQSSGLKRCNSSVSKTAGPRLSASLQTGAASSLRTTGPVFILNRGPIKVWPTQWASTQPWVLWSRSTWLTHKS